jgi:hypothetical protein
MFLSSVKGTSEITFSLMSLRTEKQTHVPVNKPDVHCGNIVDWSECHSLVSLVR